MATAVASKKVSESKSFPKQLKITLSHREKSGYKWKHNGETIDYPGRKNIIHEDRHTLTKELVAYYNLLWGSEVLKVGDGENDNIVMTTDGITIGNIGDVAQTRRIKGVATIWKIEQERRGYQPSVDDWIWMDKGELQLDASADKGLYLAVMMSNMNDSFPYHEEQFASTSIMIDDKQQAARTKMDEMNDQEAAQDLIREAYDRKTGKFDESKMEFFNRVFLGVIGKYPTNEEKYVVLLDFAKTNSQDVLKVLKSKDVSVLAVINAAMNAQILIRDKDKVTNTLTQTNVIAIEEKMNTNGIVDLLIDHYLSKQGKEQYEALEKAVEAHQKSLSN